MLKAYAENLRRRRRALALLPQCDFDYVTRLANDVFHVGGVSYKGHNDYVVVIDKHGKIAGMFNGYNQDDLLQGVELLKTLPRREASTAVPAPVVARGGCMSAVEPRCLPQPRRSGRVRGRSPRAAHPLAHLNAALNSLATILLLLAYWQIKRGRETAHGRTMLAALGVSVAFLISYLSYHALVGHVKFTHPGWPRFAYALVLGTHVPLAFTVPFLAVSAAWFGAKAVGWGPAANLSPDERLRYRAKHLRLVRWAYPIWLYVSVTGVIVYLMLYHLWPSAAL